MKLISLITIATLFTSCASGIRPASERQFVINKKNTGGFNAAHMFLSSNLNDPTRGIKYANKDTGSIVIDSNITCNLFRQFGDINNYILKFRLTAVYKGKKAKLKFDNVFVAYPTGKPVMFGGNQITSPEKLEESKKCLSGLIQGL